MSVAIGELQAAFCATLVDELSRAGVTHAVVCPGSRSTPLALALAASNIELTIRLDERSAGFVALGMAKASRRPVAIVVTSGTAVAELLPAISEADLDGVPLVALTADRPPELHGIGAPQTIEQRGIFEGHVRASHDLGQVHAVPPSSWRSIASRVVSDACGALPGPVHLNLSFTEPLVATPTSIPPGRPSGEPWIDHWSLPVAHRQDSVVLPARRGVIVAGGGCGDRASVVAAARRLGWPIIADPRSGVRNAGDVSVTAADLILRSEVAARELRPDLVVLAGAPHASKVLTTWLLELDAPVVGLGPWGPARHPTRLAATFLDGEPSSWWHLLAAPAPEEGWRERWMLAERAVNDLVQSETEDAWNEPAIARALASLDIQAGDAVLVASSSMPIRDLEWFGGPMDGWGAVLANRGANGIDGVTSTAIGAAIGSSRPVVLLIGDLAFLHDLSALVDEVPDASVTVVVVDNGGGGIFSFLPQANSVDAVDFEMLFGTPHHIDVIGAVRALGHRATAVSSIDALIQEVRDAMNRSGITVLRCEMPSRADNVTAHQQLVDLAGSAVARALA